MKENIISICSVISGLLPNKKVKCIICEEECYYSGFGNEDALKFNKGEHIDLKKYKVRVICTDCMHTLFEKEATMIGQILKISEMETLVKTAKMFMGDHLRKSN